MNSKLLQIKLSIHSFRAINYLVHIWFSFIITLFRNFIIFSVHVLLNIIRNNSTGLTRNHCIFSIISTNKKVIVFFITQQRQINWLYMIIVILMFHVIIHCQNLSDHSMTVLNIISTFIVCSILSNNSSIISCITNYYGTAYYNKNNNNIANKQTTKELEHFNIIPYRAPTQELDHFTLFRIIRFIVNLMVLFIPQRRQINWSYINSVILMFQVINHCQNLSDHFNVLNIIILFAMMWYIITFIVCLKLNINNSIISYNTKYYETTQYNKNNNNNINKQTTIICTFVSLYGSILLHKKANKLCADNIFVAFSYSENDETYLSFVAICLFLSIYYYTLRAMQLTYSKYFISHFKVLYLSLFAAIGLLLSIRYYTLRAIVVINYSAFWLLFIILYSIVVNCPIKLPMVYKSILCKCFISLLFDLINHFIRTILSVSIPLLFALVVFSDLIIISETIGRKNQTDIFLVGSSNNITNYGDDTTFILLNPPFSLLCIIQYKHKYKHNLIGYCVLSITFISKLFTIFKQMSFQNESLLSLALITVGLNGKFNKTLSIIDKLVYVANDAIIHMLKHLLFKTNYLLSITAICLLLCARHYTLRILLLTLIQLLLVLNISAINLRKNQREISLGTSSNNNTNYVDGTIHTLTTENEFYGGGTSSVGLLNPPSHTLHNENEYYGGGLALFIYVVILILIWVFYHKIRVSVTRNH